MSVKHPIIAITGSSGAGTTTVKRAFEHIFRREEITPAVIEGDSYHAYDRKAMKQKISEYLEKGINISHFGPEANVFDKLYDTFRQYGDTGMCQRRYYLHSEEEAEPYNHLKLEPGQFTPWENIPENTDLLFYEGARRPYQIHGSGCCLSAAIVGYMARGEDLETACMKAKNFVSCAIDNAVSSSMKGTRMINPAACLGSCCFSGIL